MRGGSADGTIRLAVPDDAPSIASLWRRSRAASVPAIPAPVHGADEVLSWFAAALIPRGGTFVLDQDGRPVALLVLEAGWVDQLYVDPERTGHGFGSALLEHAKQVSDGTLELWTFESNTRARDFYARHGFVPVGGTDSDNEEGQPAIRLRWVRVPALAVDPLRPRRHDRQVEPARFVAEPNGSSIAGDHWEGRGPTVVFLHAALTDRRSWTTTIEALAGRLTAVTYDRRGFGETPPSRSSWSQFADLVAVLDHVGADQHVWLVGGSAGGAIALEAARRAGHRVAGLVLLAPAVTGAPVVAPDPVSAAIGQQIDAAEARGDLDEVNRLELHLLLDGPGQPEGRVGGAERALIAETNRIALENEGRGVEPSPAEATWDSLGDITQPALVLCGSLDLPLFRSRSEVLGTVLPKGLYEAVHGTAHLPQVEQPNEVAQHILTALDTRS